MKTRNTTLMKLVLAALFVALGYVATIIIQVPTVTGYVNLGDCVVILCGFVLGPVYGFIAGGMGPALADLISGYGYYVPGTFIIKGCVALIACMILRAFYQKGKEPTIPCLIAATVPAEVFMALGYFAYKATILKAGLGAAAGIPADLMQGLMGVIISVVLFRLLYRVPALRERFWKG